jgi:hypothetical protein
MPAGIRSFIIYRCPFLLANGKYVWLISSGATGLDTLCTSFSWSDNDFLLALEEVDLDETAKKLVEAGMALEILLLLPFVTGKVPVGLVWVSLVLI